MRPEEKQSTAALTVAATCGHQKTRSASSPVIALWDVRVGSSHRIAWRGRRPDPGPFSCPQRCERAMMPNHNMGGDIATLRGLRGRSVFCPAQGGDHTMMTWGLKRHLLFLLCVASILGSALHVML